MSAGPLVEADRHDRPLLLVAEDDPLFRLGQLAILLHVCADHHPAGLDIDRLAGYGFFAAHPLLLTESDADPDRMTLLMAGFDDRGPAYASAAHRYVTHRLRVPADLARLSAYGLVETITAGRVTYRPTPAGRRVAEAFTAIYARSYTTAARITLRRLHRLSDKALRQRLRALARRPPDPVLSVRHDPTHDEPGRTGET